jgi:cyclic pyranopterin phosphate synthase
MAQFAAGKGLILRFIELMPIGPGKEMEDRYVPTQVVRERLSRKWTMLPFGKRLGRGPAEYFKIVELGSVIGLIHPVSEPFCQKCNRVRLSADGRLQDCLAYDEPLSLHELLKTPTVTDAEIEARIRQMITIKRSDHGGFLLPQCPATSGMYGIGG